MPRLIKTPVSWSFKKSSISKHSSPSCLWICLHTYGCCDFLPLPFSSAFITTTPIILLPLLLPSFMPFLLASSPLRFQLQACCSSKIILQPLTSLRPFRQSILLTYFRNAIRNPHIFSKGQWKNPHCFGHGEEFSSNFATSSFQLLTNLVET